MFWQSVAGGITVLGNIEVLTGVAMYLLVAALMLLSITLKEPKLTIEELEWQRMREDLFHEPIRTRTASFWQTTVFSIVSSVALGFVLAWLLPLLLGSSSSTPSTLVFKLSWTVVAYAAIAWAGIALIAFIPFVGMIIARSLGLQVFLTGVIILHCLLPDFYGLPSYRRGLFASPGIIESVGYLVLTGALVRGIGFLTFFLFRASESRGGMPQDLRVAPKVIVPLLTIMGGMLPLFMYARYIGLALGK